MVKFGDELTDHLVPEWRKQYFEYKRVKDQFVKECTKAEMADSPETKRSIIMQLERNFFAECNSELVKIELFFGQKIAEVNGKHHELMRELAIFKYRFTIFFN
jgi:SPX domain protein involved in polyphosphate accumulation